MMKQTSKQILTMLAFVLPLLGSVGGGMAQSVVTLIVTDPLTGIALNGLDPVSYFSESVPVAGRSEYELQWNHVPWYFANQANRDVFERAPQIYAPQFGGHDAMAVSRGFIADSDPRIHAVFKQRLYLFYSAANREAFLLAPDAAARSAEENWPHLSRDLSVN